MCLYCRNPMSCKVLCHRCPAATPTRPKAMHDPYLCPPPRAPNLPPVIFLINQSPTAVAAAASIFANRNLHRQSNNTFDILYIIHTQLCVFSSINRLIDSPIHSFMSSPLTHSFVLDVFCPSCSSVSPLCGCVSVDTVKLM